MLEKTTRMIYCPCGFLLNVMKHSLFLALSLSLLFAAPLHAQKADPVLEKLNALERSIQAMQADSVARNEKVASALSSMDQIKLDYQSVVGSIDGNSHQIRMLQDEMNRLKRDIADRLSAIEERLQIYDMQISKAVAKISPQALTETDSYQKGLDQVHSGEFLSAVASFRTFLKSYPRSELSDNAQYWIAECYYAMRDYAKAIKEFQLVVERYPRSEKASGAVLKQGFSFAELGMTEEAKAFLNKVIKDYPGSEEAVRAKERMDKLEKKTAQEAVPSTAVNPVSAPPVEDAHSSIPLAPGVKRELQQKTPAETPVKPVFSGQER
jgi:tol-pal system protein YbgF